MKKEKIKFIRLPKKILIAICTDCGLEVWTRVIPFEADPSYLDSPAKGLCWKCFKKTT